MKKTTIEKEIRKLQKFKCLDSTPVNTARLGMLVALYWVSGKLYNPSKILKEINDIYDQATKGKRL